MHHMGSGHSIIDLVLQTSILLNKVNALLAPVLIVVVMEIDSGLAVNLFSIYSDTLPNSPYYTDLLSIYS